MALCEKSPRVFVILDRDGTLIVHRPYLSDPDQVELTPHAGEGLRLLQSLGLGLLVVTNQSAVGRGLVTWETLQAIHSRIEVLLAREGVHLHGIYVCPHVPEDHCMCRKPKPGLVLEAARSFGFKPEECYVVGDNACDVGLGKALKATTFFLRSVYGAPEGLKCTIKADFVVEHLFKAAEKIRDLVAVRQGRS